MCYALCKALPIFYLIITTLPFVEDEIKARKVDVVCPRSPSLCMGFEIMPVGLRGPCSSCTAWVHELATKGMDQNFILSVIFYDANFCGSTHQWHKIASGESGLKGTKFCCIVSSSVVFCKTKPVRAISFTADIMPSLEDGRQ